MTKLQENYQQNVIKKLMSSLNITNIMAVPKIKKVVINMGVSSPQDARERKKIIEGIMTQFSIIAGQKANMTLARKSISTFKLRQGDPLGVMVTLRGAHMWEFLQKLISVALPRVKDFRGVKKTGFDGQGNFSMGIEEQIIFPEINYDTIDKVRSLQVTITTSTKENAHALALLTELGVPFTKEA
jgi:large subunit ribosomal protein L5